MRWRVCFTTSCLKTSLKDPAVRARPIELPNMVEAPGVQSGDTAVGSKNVIENVKRENGWPVNQSMRLISRRPAEPVFFFRILSPALYSDLKARSERMGDFWMKEEKKKESSGQKLQHTKQTRNFALADTGIA